MSPEIVAMNKDIVVLSISRRFGASRTLPDGGQEPSLSPARAPQRKVTGDDELEATNVECPDQNHAFSSLLSPRIIPVHRG
jgi:hypothetical protein